MSKDYHPIRKHFATASVHSSNETPDIPAIDGGRTGLSANGQTGRGHAVDPVGRSESQLSNDRDRAEGAMAGNRTEGSVEAAARRGLLLPGGREQRAVHD